VKFVSDIVDLSG